jgi:hypothetical protein
MGGGFGGPGNGQQGSGLNVVDPGALGGSRMPEWTSTGPGAGSSTDVNAAPEGAVAPPGATTFNPTVNTTTAPTTSPGSNLGFPSGGYAQVAKDMGAWGRGNTEVQATANGGGGSMNEASALANAQANASYDQKIAADAAAAAASANQGPQGLTAEQVAKQIEDDRKAQQARGQEQVYVPLQYQVDGNWLAANGGVTQFNGVNLPKGLDAWNAYGYSDPSQGYGTRDGGMTAALPQGMKAGDTVAADKMGTLPTMSRALYESNMAMYGSPYGAAGNPQRTLTPYQQSFLMSGGG